MKMKFDNLFRSPFGWLALTLTLASMTGTASFTATPTLTSTTTVTTTSTSTGTLTATSTISSTITSSRTVTSSSTSTSGATQVWSTSTQTPTLTSTLSKSTNHCPTILYPNSLQGRLVGRAGLVSWVNCVDGYTGGGYNFCQEDGTWIGTVPQCTEIPPTPCTDVIVTFTTDSLAPQVGWFVNRTNYSMAIGSVPANTVFSQTFCVTRSRESLFLYGSPVFKQQGFAKIVYNGTARCVTTTTTEGVVYKLLSCRGESVVRGGETNETSTETEQSTGLPMWVWIIVGVTILALAGLPVVAMMICRRQQPQEVLLEVPSTPTTGLDQPHRCPANTPHATRILRTSITTARAGIERTCSALASIVKEDPQDSDGTLIINISDTTAMDDPPRAQ